MTYISALLVAVALLTVIVIWTLVEFFIHRKKKKF